MKTYKSKWTVHHICNKTSGGTNHNDNRVYLKEGEHCGLHSYFQNMLTHQKILKILDDDQSAIVTEALEEIRGAIIPILEKRLKEKTLYKEHCLKKHPKKL